MPQESRIYKMQWILTNLLCNYLIWFQHPLPLNIFFVSVFEVEEQSKLKCMEIFASYDSVKWTPTTSQKPSCFESEGQANYDNNESGSTLVSRNVSASLAGGGYYDFVNISFFVILSIYALFFICRGKCSEAQLCLRFLEKQATMFILKVALYFYPLTFSSYTLKIQDLIQEKRKKEVRMQNAIMQWAFLRKSNYLSSVARIQKFHTYITHMLSYWFFEIKRRWICLCADSCGYVL